MLWLALLATTLQSMHVVLLVVFGKIYKLLFLKTKCPGAKSKEALDRIFPES